MKKSIITHSAAAAIALLTFATTARGSVPVPITNAGFENPAKTEGAWQATVPGWSQGQYDVTAPTVWSVGVPSNYVGLYNPSTGEYTSGAAPEGFNVGFSTSEPGFDIGLNQVLAASLQTDAQYNLSVKVGNPSLYNSGATADWRIELLAGGVVVASATGPSPATDTSFTTASLVYSSGAAPAQLDQPLEIRLLAINFTSGKEVDFDNVQLTATYANPVAAPGGPYSVLSVGSLTLNGSGSLSSDGSSISLYEWDLNNDGIFGDVTGATPVAIPATTLMSTYGMMLCENTIKLRVTDVAAKTSSTSTTVTLVAASSDANLVSLATNPYADLTPYFDSGTLSYTATVPYATSSITVTPIKENAGASITVNGNTVTSGFPSGAIPLSVGPNTITTVVTAEDTTTVQTYTLTVTRSAPSNNANLASLATSPDMVLIPTFDSGTLSYTTTVPNPTTTMTVTPTAADTRATIKVNTKPVTSGSTSAPINLSVGATVITTVVTAEDATTQTYTLTVTREPDTTPPTIASLSPADDTAAASTSNLAVTFDEPIAIGTGNITIKNTDPVPVSDVVIPITSGSPQVSVTGTVLTINPPADLVVGKSYAIQIDATAIKYTSGNFFLGVADNTTWNFIATLPSYTWTQPAGGTQAWITGANWLGGAVPNPATGATVDFSTANITAATTLTLGADRTAETWKFGDATTVSHDWTVSASDNKKMILSGTTPTINVVNRTATLNNVIDGTQGLTKAGTGALTLSGTNTYSGGTFINGGGTLSISADANFGATSGAVTVNSSFTLLSGTNLTLNRAFVLGSGTILTWDVGANNNDTTISGAVTGNGGIKVTDTLGLRLTSTGNTFTGPITMGNGIYAGRLYVNSIGDASGAGTIQVGSASGYGAGTFQWDTGATSPLTLNYRQIDVASPAGSANIVNTNATAANIITVNTDLLSTVAGTKTLALSGSNTGDNLIAGKIVNGSGTVGLSKQGNGTWIVSGANIYTGGTTVSAGTLKANGAGTLSTGAVTVTGGTLVIGATNAMADTASLYLPSAITKNLTLNADQAVAKLFVGGVQQPNGAYTAATNASAWMNGSGTLTVGQAAAQPVYWDLDGATAGAGGATPAGTWNGANTLWNDAAGTGTAAAWTAGRTDGRPPSPPAWMLPEPTPSPWPTRRTSAA